MVPGKEDYKHHADSKLIIDSFPGVKRKGKKINVGGKNSGSFPLDPFIFQG